jgi:hypothetical protein
VVLIASGEEQGESGSARDKLARRKHLPTGDVMGHTPLFLSSKTPA